ncbi:MAG TPA: ABC transporter ATP-binding protein [Rectinemataceae bacterium]|nr:ABC transporter ATP-binding protein [Rectinemataceae bacterium]
MTSIRIVEIEKRFGTLRALKGVSVAIEPGELFTLLGPSGCGKTTLLRTVAGFNRQDSGDIFLGEELVNDQPAHRRETGMVFQNYAVFPHMTVFDNVAYGLRVRRQGRKEIASKVEAALRRVRLEGLDQRTPDKLSGGQQQRVGLARAMAIEPRVLLLDEPLSNLDAKLRVEMRGEIRDIQKQLGITSIYVTHDQEEALVISDRIAVMESGVIQQVGPPWAIYKDPVNLFVASFVGSMNLIDAEILGEGPGGTVRAAAAGCELLIPAPADSYTSKAIRIAFRPEDAAEPVAGGPANELRATVRTASFLGSAVSLELELGGRIILVERSRPSALDILKAGSQTSFSVPLDSILLFHPATGDRVPAKRSRG